MSSLYPAKSTVRTMRKSVDGEVRSLCGREYLVVPVVALVEGVRHAGNSEHPELVLADSFGRHVDTWNGRPVVLNHPIDSSGRAVLASSPAILESSYLGELLNAHVEDGKLLVEVWLDILAIQASTNPAVTAMWKRLTAGETIEVSVGAIVYTIDEKGKYGGKRYSGRWNIVIPDHLATLDGEQIGACSIEDGCGTFRTQSAGQIRLSGDTRMAAMRVMAEKGGVGAGAGEGGRGDIRTSGTMVGSSCGCKDKSDSSECSCSSGDDARLASAVSRALFNEETFEQDRRALLSRALRERLKKPVYLVSYNGNVAVFEMECPGGYKLFQLPYKSDDSNTITLDKGEPVEVMFQVKTVTMATGKEKAMSNRGKVRQAQEEIDDTEAGDEREDEVEAPRTRPRRLAAAAPARSVGLDISSIETVHDLAKAIEGTPLGKALSSTIAVADAVRDKAITAILSTPAGKTSFTKEMLSDMRFDVLDSMARSFSMAAQAGAAAAPAASDGNGEGSQTTGAAAMDMSYMQYNGKPSGQAAAPVQGNARSEEAVAPVYSGKAGARAAAGRGVPPPPDVFTFEGGKLKN